MIKRKFWGKKKWKIILIELKTKWLKFGYTRSNTWKYDLKKPDTIIW